MRCLFWLRRFLCPCCRTREIAWHDCALDARYYDDGFHEFCAQCRWCFEIWDHPVQSGAALDRPE